MHGKVSCMKQICCHLVAMKLSYLFARWGFQREKNSHFCLRCAQWHSTSSGNQLFTYLMCLTTLMCLTQFTCLGLCIFHVIKAHLTPTWVTLSRFSLHVTSRTSRASMSDVFDVFLTHRQETFCCSGVNESVSPGLRSSSHAALYRVNRPIDIHFRTGRRAELLLWWWKAGFAPGSEHVWSCECVCMCVVMCCESANQDEIQIVVRLWSSNGSGKREFCSNQWLWSCWMWRN